MDNQFGGYIPESVEISNNEFKGGSKQKSKKKKKSEQEKVKHIDELLTKEFKEHYLNKKM